MPGKDTHLNFILILLLAIGILTGTYYLSATGINASKIPFIGSTKKLTPPKYPQKLILKSSAFENMGNIPDKYTCKGENFNPPLEITNIPANTKSLVLIMSDPNAPLKEFDHWVMFNIDPDVRSIAENTIPTGGILGQNSYGKGEYAGPCPVKGQHAYEFKLFALDELLTTGEGISRTQLEKIINGHVLDKAVLIGTFGE